jgi:hypothetical protein
MVLTCTRPDALIGATVGRITRDTRWELVGEVPLCFAEVPLCFAEVAGDSLLLHLLPDDGFGSIVTYATRLLAHDG